MMIQKHRAGYTDKKYYHTKINDRNTCREEQVINKCAAVCIINNDYWSLFQGSWREKKRVAFMGR